MVRKSFVGLVDVSVSKSAGYLNYVAECTKGIFNIIVSLVRLRNFSEAHEGNNHIKNAFRCHKQRKAYS